MKYIRLIICILMGVSITACGQAQSGNNLLLDTTTVESPSTSLEEDIGTMLLVGFRGTAIDSSHHIWRDIKNYHIGGVILFDYDAPTGTRGRNIQNKKQLQALCHQLHFLSPTLLIGIDQEGGSVSRLSPRYGFPRIPSAKQLAEMGNDSLRHYADITGTLLSELGINLNFAPVADVDINPLCPVIGALGRSFSSNEKRVSDCCQIWIAEQLKHGVISCMKHFPGHGSASGDTHRGLVDVSRTWQRREIEPYRNLPDRTMVMTAHVINRQIDKQGLPASLSSATMATLRDTLGFDGVIITDDMAMGAIANQYGFEEAIELAVMAGADLLCLSNNGNGGYDPEVVPKVVAIINSMLQKGKITEERIRTSASRIRKLSKGQ